MSELRKVANELMNARMTGDTDRVAVLQNRADNLMKLAQKSSRVDVVKINNLINDDNASAIKVYDFLNEKLGKDWWEWEIETIERMLFINYGTALEDINRDKILAIKHACNSDLAFSDWYAFNQLSLALSGVMADFEYLKSPTPGMVVNCVRTLSHIRPDGEYGEDVKKYISIIFIENGIYIPGPTIVEIVKDEFQKLVSDDIKKRWSAILKRYRDFVGGSVDVRETIEDIQAKRLVVAEGAGADYGI